MKLTTLRLLVDDLAKSQQWYTQFLAKDPMEVSQDYCSFDCSGVVVELVLADSKNPCSPGGSISYWQVKDLNATLDRLQALGAQIYRGPLFVESTHTWIVQIENPCGNILGFTASDYRPT